MNTYRAFFGLQQDPFANDLSLKQIMKTPELSAVENRFNYALSLGGVAAITGDIGSGKSTAVRYAQSQLHPSEYISFHVIATSGAILELYRQIAAALGIPRITNSKALMTSMIRNEITNLVSSRKLKPVLIIDEASLLRLEVFAELHTLLQFDQDAKHYLPLILVGQATVIDKLSFRTSAPLASRVITRCHLEGLTLSDMHQYICHHIRLCGIESNLFEESAVTAVHQGSGGLLRKANHLARGALIAAAKQKSRQVLADHVQIASTELI